MFCFVSSFFYRISSRKTLLLGVPLTIFFPAYIFKGIEKKLSIYAAETIGLLDGLFEFNPTKIRYMVAQYGPVGRAYYVNAVLMADLVYPLVYTFLFCIILSLLYHGRRYGVSPSVNVVPLWILFFDYLENICIIYLLKTFPNTGLMAAAFCSLMTNLKWGTGAVVAFLVAYGLFRRLHEPGVNQAS